jgi:hypothetical protein
VFCSSEMELLQTSVGEDEREGNRSELEPSSMDKGGGESELCPFMISAMPAPCESFPGDDVFCSSELELLRTSVGEEEREGNRSELEPSSMDKGGGESALCSFMVSECFNGSTLSQLLDSSQQWRQRTS